MDDEGHVRVFQLLKLNVRVPLRIFKIFFFHFLRQNKKCRLVKGGKNTSRTARREVHAHQHNCPPRHMPEASYAVALSDRFALCADNGHHRGFRSSNSNLLSQQSPDYRGHPDIRIRNNLNKLNHTRRGICRVIGIPCQYPFSILLLS